MPNPENLVNPVNRGSDKKDNTTTVYNFTVEDTHTYFAEGILVHNANSSYDENMVVLQGYAIQQVEKSLNTGVNLSQTIEDLIQITETNPNLSSLNQFKLGIGLRQLQLDVLTTNDQTTKQAIKNALQKIKYAQRQGVLKATEPIAASIHQSVQTMGHFSSANGPGGGQVACAWCINKVLNHAGIKTLGQPKPNLVLRIEKDLQTGMGIKISQLETKAGDLTLVDGGGTRQHIGICLNDGCTSVISNSSSQASFSWVSGPGFRYPGGRYNNLQPKFYRVIRKR